MQNQEAREKMAKIRNAGLPGLYEDLQEGLCYMLWSPEHGNLLARFSLDDEGRYDVTLDAIDQHGDFARNLEWETCDDHVHAVQEMRALMLKYGRARE